MNSDTEKALYQYALWLEDREKGARFKDTLYDLTEVNLSYANLSYTNLSHANLHKVNLSYANLHNVNLSYTDLSHANLSNVNLSWADLNTTDLTSADLTSAYLCYTNLRNTALKNINLRDAVTAHARNFKDAGYDDRGYHFYANIYNNEIIIYAGCRRFTVAEAIIHWRAKKNKDALARVAVLKTLTITE